MFSHNSQCEGRNNICNKLICNEFLTFSVTAQSPEYISLKLQWLKFLYSTFTIYHMVYPTCLVLLLKSGWHRRKKEFRILKSLQLQGQSNFCIVDLILTFHLKIHVQNNYTNREIMHPHVNFRDLNSIPRNFACMQGLRQTSPVYTLSATSCLYQMGHRTIHFWQHAGSHDSNPIDNVILISSKIANA